MHQRDLDIRRLFVDTQAASAVNAGREHLELARSYLASATWRLSIKPSSSICRVASLGDGPDDPGPKNSADWSLAE